MGIKRPVAIVIVALAVAALIVSGASAAKPKPYKGIGGSTQGAVAKGAAASPANTARSSGPLPFTGLSLGLFGLGGAALIVTGVTLNRASRKRV